MISKRLTLGSAQFGGNYGIANTNGKVKVSEVYNIFNYAYEKGIDTIETAIAYGNSEQVIGQYLGNHSNEKWSVITKIKGLSEHLHDQINQSIDRIGKIPDAVLAHSASDYLVPTFCKALHQLKKTQKINQVGVSIYSMDDISLIEESSFKPDIIQLPLNILDTRLYRYGFLKKLHDQGVEIHARSVFLQGLFYLPERELLTRFKDAMPYMNKLRSIASEAELTLPELSLLWLVSLKEISKVVIGFDNTDQLKMHLKTVKKNPDSTIFKKALSVHYENDIILNPSLWPSIS